MKKILAMLTTVVLAVTTICQTAVFAAFSDVDDTNPYKKAITTLSKLSVIDGYEDGTFKPEGEITRAEFTKLIVFMLGYQNLTYSDYEFTDVTSDHWAKNYIQTAYNLGIIAGYGDGVFSPDSPVTYEQALKMVVCTLGYDQFALELALTSDNWADKYIQEAVKLSLTKNVSGAAYSSGAPRGVIAQVLYNALEVEIYEYNGYEWNHTDKTLLNDYLKAKELKGTLVGVEDLVTEECTYNLGEEQMDIMTSDGEEILINYSSYTSNKSDISKYLGNTIIVYYRQSSSNDEKMLIIIDDETSKNSHIELSYNDISSFSGNTLKYFDSSSKVKTAKLKETDLTVRYNGDIVSASDPVKLTNPDTKTEETFSRQEALEKWLNPDTPYTIYGNIKLTDSGNDGTIDMIQINNYETIVAYAAPTAADYRITDKLVTGNYLILDPQAANYTYTITKNGAEIPVTSIAANDVILYARSLDGSHYSLLVSNKTVNGSISSLASDNSRMTINGTSYDIGDTCAPYIREKNNKELKTGISGTFYLDALDTVVFGTLDQIATIPYAYIADAFLDYDEGGKAYITAYTPNTSASSAAS
ncbi:MAG: S-layer homology domain-containing protein, partial [Hominilimicola sp.]